MFGIVNFFTLATLTESTKIFMGSINPSVYIFKNDLSSYACQSFPILRIYLSIYPVDTPKEEYYQNQK